MISRKACVSAVFVVFHSFHSAYYEYEYLLLF